MDDTVELDLASKEVEPSLGQVLKNMDQALVDKDGIKPSEAWDFREMVRAKYQLPDSGLRLIDPVEYIRRVERLLKDKKITIRPGHEFQPFFNENPETEAVNFKASVFRDATVVLGGDAESSLAKKARLLAHEAVHALQNFFYPRMPLETKEKEAYYYELLTPQSILMFKSDPEGFYGAVNETFDLLIKLSVSVDKKLNGDVASGGK